MVKNQKTNVTKVSQFYRSEKAKGAISRKGIAAFLRIFSRKIELKPGVATKARKVPKSVGTNGKNIHVV